MPGLNAPNGPELFSDEKDFDVPEDFLRGYQSIGGSDRAADGDGDGDDLAETSRKLLP